LRAGRVPVEVAAPGDPGGPISGRVEFIDNQIDAATGTIALRAIFDNSNERLWPGEFVNASMTLGEETDVVVVPAAAIQVGQSGTYVFVVRPDGTAEARPVTVGRSVDGFSAISKGLSEGERVVIDGQLRLTNGSRVDIRTSADTPPGTERRS
jgi:multidrug efflux system membrane fusion protein